MFGAIQGAALIYLPAPWTVEISAAYMPSQTFMVDPSHGATETMAFFGAALCPRLNATDRLQFLICVGAQLGWLDARGVGFSNQDLDAQQWMALVTAHASAALRLAGPLRISLGAGVDAPVPSPSLVYNTSAPPGGQPVMSPLYGWPPVIGVLDVGLGATF